MTQPRSSVPDRPLRRLLAGAALLPLALAPATAAQQALQFSLSTQDVLATNMALGDVDGDGRADLASSGNVIGTTQVQLGQGDGSFAGGASLPLTAMSLILGPVDAGNGDLDLVTGDTSGQITIHLGDGAGGFTIAGSAHSLGSSGSSHPRDLELGDLDGDGLTDVAVACGLPSAAASFLLGDGAGGLTFSSAVPIEGLFPRGIELGDFDADGDLDAVFGAGGVELTLLSNLGGGVFTETAQLGDLSGAPGADLYGVDVAVADLNADGLSDVIFSQTGPHDVGVLRQNGPLSFAAPVYHGVGHSPERLAVADVDGDGALDLFAANSHARRMLVIRGDGAGGLATESSWPLSESASLVAAGDLDGDGDPDVLALDAGQGHLDALINGGPGPFANLGGGIPQFQDLPAVLTGSGSMVAGAPNQLELVFAEGNTSILVVGVSALSAAFKGGLLVPNHDLLLGGLIIGPQDQLLVPFVVPASSPPGTDVWVQHWFPSAVGPAGWIASNALRATVQ